MMILHEWNLFNEIEYTKSFKIDNDSSNKFRINLNITILKAPCYCKQILLILLINQLLIIFLL